MWTNDLERLRKFYETWFGAKAGERYFNPNRQFFSYFLSFANSDCRLEIMQIPDLNEPMNSIENQYVGLAHFAISVGTKETVDTLTQQLKQAGYTIASNPRTTGDGYYESVILDPDGNKVELVESEELRVRSEE